MFHAELYNWVSYQVEPFQETVTIKGFYFLEYLE